jgi:hypothetical protein
VKAQKLSQDLGKGTMIRTDGPGALRIIVKSNRDAARTDETLPMEESERGAVERSRQSRLALGSTGRKWAALGSNGRLLGDRVGSLAAMQLRPWQQGCSRAARLRSVYAAPCLRSLSAPASIV